MWPMKIQRRQKNRASPVVFAFSSFSLCLSFLTYFFFCREVKKGRTKYAEKLIFFLESNKRHLRLLRLFDYPNLPERKIITQKKTLLNPIGGRK